MSTKVMFSALALLVVVMVMTEGSPVAPEQTTAAAAVEGNAFYNNQTECPPVLFVVRNGQCEFYNDEVKHKVEAEFRKRQASSACPYCAPGVYDAYPDWSDCSKLNYCLDGRIISMSCMDMGSRYFNPSLKACELYNNPSNICLHRSVNLLNTS